MAMSKQKATKETSVYKKWTETILEELVAEAYEEYTATPSLKNMIKWKVLALALEHPEGYRSIIDNILYAIADNILPVIKQNEAVIERVSEENSANGSIS